MNKMIFFIIFALVGYAFGCIPTGYLYAKAKGKNIYALGSNSPGSTNVGRVLGKKAGIIVLCLDILKTLIPILIARAVYIAIYFANDYSIVSSNLDINRSIRVVSLFVGFFAILGHSYPINMGFKGGKGIACSFATAFMYSPILAIMFFVLQKVISKVTGYVSIGSILTLVVAYIIFVILSIFKIYPFEFGVDSQVLFLFFLIIALGIYRHKDNIKRVINGNENRIIK